MRVGRREGCDSYSSLILHVSKRTLNLPEQEPWSAQAWAFGYTYMTWGHAE